MPAAAVVAVAGIAGSIMQANAAESAARTQANAMYGSARMAAEAAARARNDVLSRMVPALDDYRQGILDAQDTIAAGSADIMNILQTSTGAADQMLQSVGANARQALLGSTASAQGIPRQQFDQQYTDMMAASPEAQADFVNQTTPQTLEKYYAGLTGQPELTRDATGALGTVSDVRENAMAALDQPAPGPAVGGAPALELTSPTGGIAAGVPTGGATAMPAAQNLPSAPMVVSPDLGGVGFSGAQAQLQRGEDISLANLAQGTTIARGDILAGSQAGLESIANARTGAISDYQPYTDAGAQAMQREAALSGALGPEAQQIAIDSFIESPGQKYLREQQEKALLRSGAAIGGLGGGRMRSALMEQAMGIAATQQQQQLENLRSIAGRGQQAAGDVAGIRIGTGTTEAGIQTQAGQQLANLAQSFGMNVSQLMNLTSAQKAELAERTGVNLAQLEQTIGMARTAGIQNLGQGLATTTASATGDIAGLIERGATTGLSAEQNLASTLANIGTSQATQAASYNAGAGSALAAGQMAAGQAMAQGVQGLGNIAAYGYNRYY